MSSKPPVPLNVAAPPVRTKFGSGKDDPGGSGISWAWLKWLQSMWTSLVNLTFQNIGGKIDIAQINTSNAPAPGLFLDGDASWSAGGGGSVTSVGMLGDGVVYEATVPGSPITSAGVLAPQLKSYGPGTFIASPPTTAGQLEARTLAASDFGLDSAQGAISFTSPSGGQDTSGTVFVTAAWVKASSRIVCSVVGGTMDHPATDDDAAIEDVLASAFNIVPGSGFSVTGYAPQGSAGSYLVNCIGVS